MDDDKISIRLTMGGMYFPVSIKRSEEEIVRKAAKEVDMLFNEYKGRYPNQNQETLLFMVAYQYSLRSLQEAQRNNTAPYTEKIQQLKAELEQYLAAEQGSL